MCTLIGCVDGVSISAAIPPANATDQLEVLACVNGECMTGVVGPNPSTPCTPLEHVDGGSAFSSSVCMPDSPPSRLTVTIDLTAQGTHDGDQVSLRVRSVASDQVIVDVTRNVTYGASTPNGPDCEPTCHNAKVDLSSSP
jgi:hypothetical protein